MSQDGSAKFLYGDRSFYFTPIIVL